jgi:NTP pyrophosphatase (non-canonical NTP hydrolase)
LYCNKEVIERLGDKVMVIAMEECAELQQAISKGIRGKLDKENLTEEIADVLICIDWVMDYFDISEDEVDKWIEKKAERIKQRLRDNTLS